MRVGAAALAAIVVSLFVLHAGQNPPAAPDAAEESLRKFATVYAAVEANYADPITPENQIFKGAIPGMLRKLDPYSVFFDADQFRMLQQHQQSKSEGFGTIVSVSPGRVIVLEAFTNSPAARAGIQPGDEILQVNGYRLDRLDVEEIVQVLSAARAQPKAEMLVLRPNSSKVERIIASPAELSENTVDRAFFLRDGVGYLHVTGFENDTVAEMRKALEGWTPKLKALVLDLRDNPGGIVNGATEAAGLFLPEGTLILTARGRNAKTQELKVQKADPLAQKVPLAVLVGPKTASAAEILAGALQDNQRAKLVGQTTFGKGTVQAVYPLSEKTGLALATALYFTPSGRLIERTRSEHGGIAPDEIVAPRLFTDFQVFLENRSAFLEFARRYISSGRTIAQNGDLAPAILDEFRGFLAENQLPVNEKLWSENRNYIRARLKTELYNLAFGVAKGDQVAAESDPQVQRAVELLAQNLH